MTSAVKSLSILLFSLFLAQEILEASPVRISFLDNEDAIKQTIDFLSTNGCGQETTDLFHRVVDWYNAAPSDLDLKKFPPRQNGFYSFGSISNLVEALPRPLIYTYHQNDLSCFEAVILLGGNFIHTRLKPDDMCGPLLTPITTTNSDIIFRVAATPRDAFSFGCPSWWIEASKPIFNGSLQEQRICLMPALNSIYFLPDSTTRENLKNTVLQSLRLNWERQGIMFPKNPEIVIYHGVGADGHNFLESHAGLLFHNHDGYVYIEKAGCSGPYVRLDLRDKQDLFPWFKAAIKPVTSKGSVFFATFNNTEIDDLGESDH